MLGGCDADPERQPDARLRTHVALDATPTSASLDYLERVAAIHVEADALRGKERIDVLAEGLALPLPASDGEAEVAELDLAARLAETLIAEGRSGDAIERLSPLLEVERSLPMHVASARALVLLGDAAAAEGDEALAAGSYARAIRLMSLLRLELEAK
jgi:hypothetical protein